MFTRSHPGSMRVGFDPDWDPPVELGLGEYELESRLGAFTHELG